MTLYSINDDLKIIAARKCASNFVVQAFSKNSRVKEPSGLDFEDHFTIMIVREPMDRLQSNYSFWTGEAHRTKGSIGGHYAVGKERYLTFDEYCIRVCDTRFEAHTEDQHKELKTVRKVDYFLPLDELDDALPVLVDKMPVNVDPDIKYRNASIRGVDYFKDKAALRDRCEKAYGVDMTLYSIAKSYPITLEEAIDRWRLDDHAAPLTRT